MPRGDIHSAVRRVLQPAHRRFAGSLPIATRRRYLYLAGQGRLPNLKNPRLFSEKVNWRIVNDRRELLSWTCDKLAMKEYAVSKAHDLGVRVPKTYWSGVDINTIVGRQFESAWILKPNHRSGLVHFGGTDQSVDDATLRKVDGWLRDDQGVLLGEWAYGRARRMLIVEENIAPGVELLDFKFFVFDGVVAAIQVDQNRFTRHSRNFFGREWNPLEVENRFPAGPIVNRPADLDEMLVVAETLGAPFDFIRVDLYAVRGHIWLGEVTPYPGGGVEPFRPVDFDRWLGAKWRLPVIS